MTGVIFNARRTFVLNQLTITELVPKLAAREVSARAAMQNACTHAACASDSGVSEISGESPTVPSTPFSPAGFSTP